MFTSCICYLRLLLIFIGSTLLIPFCYAGEVEVLHWWTSGGEAKSVAVLKELLHTQGHSWKDFSIEGGGGDTAMEILSFRTISGKPPAAAQIKGLAIQDWADLGFLANLNALYAAQGWREQLPEVVRRIMRHKSQYVAVPINVHRVNWLWINPTLFKQADVAIPTTMMELFSALEKLKAAGITPIAHGKQVWQDATLFEAIALSLLGAEDYTRAFVNLDNAVLSSNKMINVLQHYKKLTDYMDFDHINISWNQATQQVIDGKAAMQFMGDWAKGEFTAAGLHPDIDYLCIAVPGTADLFSFNIDSFVMFDLNQPEATAAQQALAKTILSPEFQQQFNQSKGSIPVRLDANMDQFDRCAQASMQAFKNSAQNGKLLPSISQGLATTNQVQNAIHKVVSEYLFSTDLTAEQTAIKLAEAVKEAG